MINASLVMIRGLRSRCHYVCVRSTWLPLSALRPLSTIKLTRGTSRWTTLGCNNLCYFQHSHAKHKAALCFIILL